MTPNLIAISGSLKGTIFALTQDEISVGRDVFNSICLNDLSVSRRHCIVKRESDKEIAGPAINESDSAQVAALNGATSLFTITDLDSFNGTFVNGIPVREKELAHGDQIALGDVILLFLIDESEPAAKTLIASGEDNLITRSTIRLRRED